MSDQERAELFDEWAAGYDASLEMNQFPFDGYEAVLDEIVRQANAQPGMRVLDLGTGTGNLAQRFVILGCEVWGTDFSAAMLEVAKGKIPQAHFVQVDLLEEWPPALQQRFDRIVSAYVFHEFDLETKINLFQQLVKEHLVEGGQIIVGDISFPTVEAREEAHQRLMDQWDEDEHYWAADEAREACESVGLSLTHARISGFGAVFVIAPA